MLLPFVAALVCVQAQIDFDGLKLEVAVPPSTPIQREATKTWSGTKQSPVTGPASATIMYSVSVTDLTKVKSRPSETEALDLHELHSRTNPALAAQSLHRIDAHVGDRPLVVLVGSAVAPNRDGPITSYVLSFAFVEGDRAYEFTEVSRFEADFKVGMERMAKMTFSEDGKAPAGVSGLSFDLHGDYWVAGIPFALESPVIPRPVVPTTQDTDYAAEYSSRVSPNMGLSGTYVLYVRKLTPSDKRSDTELFKALLGLAFKSGFTPAQVSVKGGSASFDVEGVAGGKERYHFERVGSWIGLLVATVPKGAENNLDAVQLKPKPLDPAQ